MKKIKLFLCVLSFVFSLFHEAFADFSDIQYSWYRDSILQLQNEKVISGYGDGRFGPDEPVTRAEILKMMLGASKVTLSAATESEESCFPDVAKSAWYYPFVCGAHTMKIAEGFGDGTFKPNGQVTSLEALAFGLRSFGIAPATTGDTWYTAYQDLATQNNILATHVYNRSTEMHRGQVAELITRLEEYMKSKTPVSYKSTGCTTFGTLGQKNTIKINDADREYNLSIPSDYSATKEYSLIVATHGRTNSNDQVQGYMGLDRGQNDFIVVYPAGLPNGSAFSWSEKENLTFFDAMIQEISDNYCINRDKVFLVGHSLGGWMANRLACLRGDVVHGMATVGATPFSGSCTGPVASLLFQRVDDKLVSYESGKQVETIRKAANQCTEHSSTVTIGPLTCTVGDECSGGNTVTWCEGYDTYNDDAHSWPTAPRIEGGDRSSGASSNGGGAWILEYFRGLK